MKEKTGPGSYESQSTTVNGASFELLTGRVWKIPTHGKETAIELVLRITNRTDAGLRFHQFDTFRIALTAPSGRLLLFDGGRDVTRIAEVVSRLLQPNEHLLISRSAKLVWLDDGISLRLIGTEPFGGIWYFDSLGPGRYKVQFIHENDKPRVGDLDLIWTGKVITHPVQVELKESGP